VGAPERGHVGEGGADAARSHAKRHATDGFEDRERLPTALNGGYGYLRGPSDRAGAARRGRVHQIIEAPNEVMRLIVKPEGIASGIERVAAVRRAMTSPTKAVPELRGNLRLELSRGETAASQQMLRQSKR